ncbi:MAG TPA: NDP-sugar synthase [Pyrinomonadaceae bacterium]|jgi:NDP-sugar pyrophosphorylase family protein|nr:NDP-sugar synthase [Pyrinomonadaceae bacterium]
MRAMILAAGYGTRLWPLTLDRAKPALPFMGRPLVGYVAEYLARFGCDEIIVNLHHRPESVRAALGDGRDFGVRLSYIEEAPEILGTSGAIDNAREFLEGDTFIVVNGKIATDIDLGAALETHRRTRSLATLVLRPNPARERYSVVEVEDGLVKEFGGFPALDAATEDEAAPLMFTGIQILEPRIFQCIPRGVASDSVPHVYIPAIARGERIAAHTTSGMWHELSTIQRYLNISLSLMKQEGRDVQLGANAHIEAGADVREALLWEDAHVEAGARVRHAIIGAGVRIRRGEVIEDAAVVRAALVGREARPAKALAGEVRGDNFVVPLAQ